MTTPTATDGFDKLELAPAVHAVLHDLGYHTPSPIQAQMIPHMLAGRDVVGQAQTGTGKTAAFALPILSKLEPEAGAPQVLVLAPTRELANQVADAFGRYSARMKRIDVLAVYGGQDYVRQIRALKRGVHVVVGTPGRVMDHIRRGTLDLSALKALVLDEADEMLRMGFIEDVEWILEQTPKSRQTALFSATMPDAIRKVAEQYLRNAVEVVIEADLQTAETIEQRHCIVRRENKIEALCRFLEYEQSDGIIVFVRTRAATVEVSDALQARGFASAPMNGDIPQNHRERTVRALKDGRINVLVATDVAARGLDIDRLSHVINYDMPHDVEAYVHRIGRTGRAGRDGDAILFVMPNQKRKLKTIERETGQRIAYIDVPGVAMINKARAARFKQRLTDTIATSTLDEMRQLVEELQEESGHSGAEIAAAAIQLVNGGRPLFLDPSAERDNHKSARSDRRRDRDKPRDKSRDKPRDRSRDKSREKPRDKSGDKPRERSNERPRKEEQSAPSTDQRPPRKPRAEVEEGMEKYRIEVGHAHGVNTGNIVGAIANEAGLENKYIGRVNIYDDYSTVDLPEGMPNATLKHLRKVWVAGQQMNMSRAFRKKKPAAEAEAGEVTLPGKSKKPKTHKKARHKARGKKGSIQGEFRSRRKKK